MEQGQQVGGLKRRLDMAERFGFALLYVWLCYRFAGAAAEQPLNYLYLVTEGFVLLMVLLRRSAEQISIDPRDWLAAVAGTFATMLLMPGTALPGMEGPATLLLGLGLAISIAAKLQLRRSFGLVAANRGVKTRGVYGLVRHPMYLGYFLSQWGMLLINWSWWNGGLLALWSVLQIARIHAEERVLCEDPAYRGHCQRVRHRLVPLVY